MSRIGNKPIVVPTGVEIKIDGHKITVKGPKGTLEREIHKNISLEMNDNVIKVNLINLFDNGIYSFTSKDIAKRCDASRKMISVFIWAPLKI